MRRLLEASAFLHRAVGVAVVEDAQSRAAVRLRQGNGAAWVIRFRFGGWVDCGKPGATVRVVTRPREHARQAKQAPPIRQFHNDNDCI